MNWINNFVRPKISGFLTTKREVPDNLWRTCPVSGQMVFHKDLEANQFVYPGSDYHERIGAPDRLKTLFDDGAYEVVAVPEVALDPLKFRDGRRYTDRLKEAKASSELDDAILVGEGAIDGKYCVAAVQDFRFMAGSLGMAAGEAIIAGMLRAVEKKSPFVLFAASGGARMQEGILSLMQMPRTTIAVQRLREAGLPYIVVLTNPTSGGVTASYAMLGDVHIAEPGALVCFAGPRVIQQTIREQLPEGFQRSEYLLEHGMVDMVVHRHQLRSTLSRLCRVLTDGHQYAARKQPAVEKKPVAALPPAGEPQPLPEQVNGAPQPVGEKASAAKAKAIKPEPVAKKGQDKISKSVFGNGLAAPIKVKPGAKADSSAADPAKTKASTGKTDPVASSKKQGDPPSPSTKS